MIKNIAFDFGGVLFDLDYDGAIVTFKQLGLADADQRLDRFHQRGIFEALECGRSDRDTFRRELSQLLTPPREITEDEVLRAWLGYVGAPIDQRKLDYLDDLRRRGYRTFLLSNTNPYVQQWAESPQFSSAGRPLGSYLEKCYCSFEVGIMKPDPAIFRLIRGRWGLSPDRTLFIDDALPNVEAARKEGFRVWHYAGKDVL